MGKYKTGRLSIEEQLYIEQNRQDMSPQQISENISRKLETILVHLKKIPDKKIRNNFDTIKEKPFWSTIEQQFSEEELAKFQHEYNGFVVQFQGELLHSEEIQTIDAIKVGILADRILIESRNIDKENQDRQEQLFKEKNKPNKNMEKIDILEMELAASRTLVDNLVKKYDDLLQSKSKAFEKLKATRGQRQNVSNAGFKTNFRDWMRRLIDDPNFRREVGVYMEKTRLACEKQYEKWTKPHKYADGNVDIPVLDYRSSYETDGNDGETKEEPNE